MAEGIFTQPANGCGVRPARIARGDGVACVHTIASRPLVWTGSMVVRARQRPCACDAVCVSMEALVRSIRRRHSWKLRRIHMAIESSCSSFHRRVWPAAGGQGQLQEFDLSDLSDRLSLQPAKKTILH